MTGCFSENSVASGIDIYPGPVDMLRPSNKMSLRPNDRNVSYQPPITYEYLYQMPQHTNMAEVYVLYNISHNDSLCQVLLGWLAQIDNFYDSDWEVLQNVLNLNIFTSPNEYLLDRVLGLVLKAQTVMISVQLCFDTYVNSTVLLFTHIKANSKIQLLST